jgi:hypothetical protein
MLSLRGGDTVTPTYNDGADFYEEDEPIEDVLRAFDEGDKGLTGPARSATYEVEVRLRRSVFAGFWRGGGGHG